MQIREMTPEEKKEQISRIKEHLKSMRAFMRNVEDNLESSDLRTQAAALWLGGDLILVYCEFRRQIREWEDVRGLQEDMLLQENLSEVGGFENVQ